MRNVVPPPCPEWEAWLPLTHPDDLSPERRAALEAHLATCSACAAARADYERLDQAIQRVPTSRPLPVFPPELNHLTGRQSSNASPEYRRQRRPIQLARYAQGGASMFARRTRGIAMVVAIAVVVALFALVLRNAATGHHTASPAVSLATHTATPQASPKPAGTWTILPNLSNETTLPVIAPSNANVVYEAGVAIYGNGTTTLRRSDDDGATWHNLTAPPDNLPVDGMIIGISPVNASAVILSLTTSLNDHPSLCPASGALKAQSSLSGSPGCSVQYLSTDGGQHWSRIHLPIQGALGAPFFADVLFGRSVSMLQAQGQRLYSAMGKENVDGVAGGSDGLRLVRSDDGGSSWQLIDSALVVSGQNICDYAPTPAGSTLFAITQTGQFCYDNGQDISTLWRSDDAGATWTPLSHFPTATGHLTLVSQGAGAEPLLYLRQPAAVYNTPHPADSSPSNTAVSADGGKTWKQAPAKGLPSDAVQSYGPLGVLSDGSILEAFKTSDQSLTLASWKSGSAAWRPLAEEVNPSFAYWLVTPNDGKTAIWLVSLSGPDFTVQRYDLK